MILAIFIIALILLLATTSSKHGGRGGGGCIVRPMPTKPKPNIPPPAQRK